MNSRSGKLTSKEVLRGIANTPQITFEITDACNLKCEYCGYGKFYSDYDERKSKNLSVSKAKHLLDFLNSLWLSDLNVSHQQNVYISFYGGEPLMNVPFIKEVIEYIEGLNCSVRTFTFNMTTNGILLHRYMDFLVEKNIQLLISLDGNEYNTSYRVDHKGENAFARIVRNVDHLKERYPEYFERCVNFNAVLHNRNSVEEIYHFFKERYNKVPSIGELNSSGIRPEKREEFELTYKSSTESLMQSEHYSEIERGMFLKSPTYHSATIFLMQTSEHAYKDYNELLFGKQRTTDVPQIPTGTCLPFSKKVFVTVNGKLLPCERIGHQFALGHVDDHGVHLNFEEIAKRYNGYYQRVSKQCRACHNKHACTQCVFNLEGIDNSDKVVKCQGFMSKHDAEQYRNVQLRFFHENPEAYHKIMTEVIIK